MNKYFSFTTNILLTIALVTILLIATSCQQTTLTSIDNKVSEKKNLEILAPQLKEEFSLSIGQQAIIESELMGLTLNSLSREEIKINLIYNGNEKTLSFKEGQNTVEAEGYIFTILESDENQTTLSVNKLKID